MVKSGDGREYRPERGQEVTIKMESLLEDGTILQESDLIKFVVADGDVPEVNMKCFVANAFDHFSFFCYTTSEVAVLAKKRL